ncbi:DUF1307 domain-containing protein [uncultured Parvimonas sp.]|uniref:DUF1307 domain-containing protein n=1 Tax=Parvimonas sp. G1604 TaxID=3388845 RepID=UPI0028D330E6|nr:DUF1307 domain-containing protein [uncultured Parvimonas sp.]
MKKLKNILLAFTMLFVVVLTTACSDGTKKRVFVKDADGQKSTITYVYSEKEDKVLKQLTINEGIYDKLNPAMTKEEVKKIIDKEIEETKGIKGIKHTVEYKEDRFIESLEVDLENLDYEKAKNYLSIKDPKKVRVSMKVSAEIMYNQGYKEQK